MVKLELGVRIEQLSGIHWRLGLQYPHLAVLFGVEFAPQGLCLALLLGQRALRVHLAPLIKHAYLQDFPCFYIIFCCLIMFLRVKSDGLIPAFSIV